MAKPVMRTRTLRAKRRFRHAHLLAGALCAALPFWAHAQAETAHAGRPSEALGEVAFPISCSKAAQDQFNRAVALLHHMTYRAARGGFERAAALDPKCAMANWGVAMTLFQPLWPTRPGPDELQRGWRAIERAKHLEPPTERERLFIAAAEAFFRDPSSSDYWLRIRRWEEAMHRVYEAFPEDTEAGAFFALAHLAAPATGAGVKAKADRAASILEQVYARHPNHPGAMHYLVHANDVPGRERNSLDVTRKYDALAPRNPHALHMPTHIYTRLGEWGDVISGNQRAADAALEHPAGERGELVWDEFPHAIEYLVYAYLQRGMDAEALAQIRRLLATRNLEPTFKTAFHIASTQARYALERRAWSEAASLAARRPESLDWDRFRWPEAITHFARGLGAAHEGKLDDANSAVTQIERLETAAGAAGEELFAANIRLLALELRAWIAHASGRKEEAVKLMREAADLEAMTPKHAVTPAPTLPAQELLGDMLMAQAHTVDALAAYKRAQELYPNRFNALLGAARAARAGGDEQQAREFYQRLLEVAAGGAQRPQLQEAKSYIVQDGRGAR